jgi:hypothetical protein
LLLLLGILGLEHLANVGALAAFQAAHLVVSLSSSVVVPILVDGLVHFGELVLNVFFGVEPLVHLLAALADTASKAVAVLLPSPGLLVVGEWIRRERRLEDGLAHVP